MSRSQDPHRAFFSHGNPFRMILPKGSRMSPRLQSLLNKFEETLAERLRKMKQKHKEDVFSFSSMKLAMQLLSETHQDVKSFITELELPVYDWDDKWIDVYLENSVNMLDICIALSSELSRLSQGKLLLQCVLHNLDQSSTIKFLKAKSSLDSWKQHVCAKNPRIENCFSIMEKLMEILELPKVNKNSSKGKILMRAMYGVKVQTLFTCRVFISAFTSSNKNLIDLQVSNTYLWAEAFNDLQTFVNAEVKNRVSSSKNILVKDLEQVNTSIDELYPMISEAEKSEVTEAFHNSVVDLGGKVDKFSSELDLLAKEVDAFFQIVLSGRDALLCNLRVSKSNSVFDPSKKCRVKEQLVK